MQRTTLTAPLGPIGLSPLSAVAAGRARGRTGALALALAVAGCVAESGDESFVVRNNLAVEEDSCALEPSATAPFVSRGTLNLDSPIPYLLTPLIQSRITAAMGQESVRTVALRGARVDLAIGPISVEDAAGNVTFSCAAEGASACFTEAERTALATAGVTKFTSLFSAPLPPNSGLAATAFDAVSTSALREIRRKVGALPATSRLSALVVATSTIFGDLGSNELEGLPYVYPVSVCTGCVLANVGACAALPMGFVARKGNPCNPYQDGIVDCCTAGGALVCPAVKPM